MAFPAFSSGPAASVTMSDGIANRIKFTADDNSCRWNGLPVIFACRPFEADVPVDPAPAYQIAPFVTPLPSGGSPDPTTEWPFVWAYDPLFAVLQGYTLQIRIRFFTDANGVVHVANPLSGSIFAANVTVGNYDSGWVDATATFDCAQVGCSNLAVNFGTAFVPFSPFIPMTIRNGILEVRWVVGSTMHPDYFPCQQYELHFNPCGTHRGIIVCLPTNSCSALTVTYNTLATNWNSLANGVTATVLSGSGVTVKPDPGGADADCLCFDFTVTGKQRLMDGAVCSGAVDN